MDSSLALKTLLPFLNGVDHSLIFFFILYATIAGSVELDSNVEPSVYMNMSLTLYHTLDSTGSVGCLC